MGLNDGAMLKMQAVRICRAVDAALSGLRTYAVLTPGRCPGLMREPFQGCWFIRVHSGMMKRVNVSILSGRVTHFLGAMQRVNDEAPSGLWIGLKQKKPGRKICRVSNYIQMYRLLLKHENHRNYELLFYSPASLFCSTPFG